jgi:hypothetical protein
MRQNNELPLAMREPSTEDIRVNRREGSFAPFLDIPNAFPKLTVALRLGSTRCVSTNLAPVAMRTMPQGSRNINRRDCMPPNIRKMAVFHRSVMNRYT